MKITVKRGEALSGEIQVPADKSISHRAVMLGALAQGTSTIYNFLRAEDTFSTVQCMRDLGVEIIDKGDLLEVKGQGLWGLKEPAGVLNCGNSGTTIRLLSGILAGNAFFTVLQGDASLNNRPMERVIKPLTMMGAKIDGRREAKYAPLAIRGGNLRGLAYSLPVASAQVKSAILLAALYVEEMTEVKELLLSRDHTERMLQAMGATLKVDDKVIRLIGGNQLKPQEFIIPGDISSAAFFLVGASLVPGSKIRLINVGINPTRAGVIKVLRQMGAQIILENEKVVCGEPVADLVVKYAPLKGIKISGEIIPTLIDEIPVLAVAMAAAEGVSSVEDAAELRVKETDRIKAVCDNLSALGVNIKEMPDGFLIQGSGFLNGGKVDSFGDHRLAMAMGIAGLIAQEEVQLVHAEAVNISYPGFWKDLCRVTGPECISES